MGTLTRVPRTAAATLAHVFYDAGGEEPVTATGDVTVTATGPDGEDVFTGTAAGPNSAGAYTYTMPAQPQLTVLDVTWSAVIGGTTVVERDQVEIVGARLFTVAEGRASDASLDKSKYSTAHLLRVLTEVEQECEWICLQAWVPRYRQAVLDGSGTCDLVLPAGLVDEYRGGVLMRGIRVIRSASVASRVGQPAVPLPDDQLAALVVRPDGTLRRADGAVWPAGEQNIKLELEVGSDSPPPDLVRAAMTRFRDRATFDKRQVPDRAVSFTIQDMGTYRLSLPDAYRTGIPEVDAAYGRYSRRVQAGDAAGSRGAPASRTLDFNPQHHALFHGGRR